MAHLSASSITTYLDCPARFKATRIDKRAEPIGPALAVGVAMHAALEQHFRVLQQGALGGPGSGFEPDEDELRRWSASAFRRESERVTVWGRGDKTFHERSGAAAAVAIGRALPGLTPSGVEVGFSVPLREGWTLDGRIDLIAAGAVWDFKSQTADSTSEWRWHAGKARRQ
ncbi:MAG: PD-(D/E)XK nuclease family protein, partial [Thermomicrobiales bacterium]|nr:PD-(D/E)XK nuclease family protein [Thermomicrobiales bacterium]